jgi:hypothetical protein
MSDRADAPEPDELTRFEAELRGQASEKRQLMVRMAQMLARQRVETLLRNPSAASGEVTDAIRRLRAIERVAAEE